MHRLPRYLRYLDLNQVSGLKLDDGIRGCSPVFAGSQTTYTPDKSTSESLQCS
jgi:hypothetical protein